MYFSAEDLLEVNPVLMNYKIRHNKNRFFCYLWWQKMENAIWTCKAMCKGSHRERLAQLVCALARILIITGRSMTIAAFSTWDLQEQGCKSYEASL